MPLSAKPDQHKANSEDVNLSCTLGAWTECRDGEENVYYVRHGEKDEEVATIYPKNDGLKGISWWFRAPGRTQGAKGPIEEVMDEVDKILVKAGYVPLCNDCRRKTRLIIRL